MKKLYATLDYRKLPYTVPVEILGIRGDEVLVRDPHIVSNFGWEFYSAKLCDLRDFRDTLEEREEERDERS